MAAIPATPANFHNRRRNTFRLLWASDDGTDAELAAIGVSHIQLIRGARWGVPIDAENTPAAVGPHATKLHYIINIEAPWNQWNWLTNPVQAEANLAKYLRVMELARQVTPACKIGLYGQSPARNYYAAIDGPEDEDYTAWQAHNDHTKPLADALDYVCPSLYTFHPSAVVRYQDVHTHWPTYADSNISEARRIAPRQPIYPFIWHQYNGMPSEVMTAEHFAAQLLHLYHHKDVAGVIIWVPAAYIFNAGDSWAEGIALFKAAL